LNGVDPRRSATYARNMLVARAGLSPVMVGRTAELSRLQSLVGASRSPAVALIAGEAGIGKTRLARELIDSVPPGTVERPA
jgi:DNA-binding NtrC family response regulator